MILGGSPAVDLLENDAIGRRNAGARADFNCGGEHAEIAFVGITWIAQYIDAAGDGKVDGHKVCFISARRLCVV